MPDGGYRAARHHQALINLAQHTGQRNVLTSRFVLHDTKASAYANISK